MFNCEKDEKDSAGEIAVAPPSAGKAAVVELAVMRFGPTVNKQELISISKDADSTHYARQQDGNPLFDPDFPSSFTLSNAPGAKRLWFTADVITWLWKKAKQNGSNVTDVVTQQSNSSYQDVHFSDREGISSQSFKANRTSRTYRSRKAADNARSIKKEGV